MRVNTVVEVEGGSPEKGHLQIIGLKTRNLLSPERERGTDRVEERRRREAEKNRDLGKQQHSRRHPTLH